MRDFLVDLWRDYNSKTVLIIGHRATHHGLDCWINGRSLEELVQERFVWQPGWKYLLKEPIG